MAAIGQEVTFELADTKRYSVDVDIVKQSKVIKRIIDDIRMLTVIPLSKISSPVFHKILDYCRYHHTLHDADAVVIWDTAFVDVSQSMLISILLAADYLEIAGLIDLLCHTIANMMLGKTPEEVRLQFSMFTLIYGNTGYANTCLDITNDFTPEEEEKIRKENVWCEDF